MSQKSIETVIGRLVTDEELRARFNEDPARTLRELAEQGLSLTKTETAALLACGHRFIAAIAAAIDPRIERACLKPRRPGEEGSDGEPS